MGWDSFKEVYKPLFKEWLTMDPDDGDRSALLDRVLDLQDANQKFAAEVEAEVCEDLALEKLGVKCRRVWVVV